MKASMEGVLPMLGLVILAAGMASQGIPLSEAFANIVSENAVDVERVTDTRAFGDFYFYNYVPLAGEYSFNKASEELGEDGGGLDWDQDLIENNFYESLMDDIEGNVESLSSEILSGRVDGTEHAGCEIDNTDYEIRIFEGYHTSEYEEMRKNDTESLISHEIADIDYPPGLPRPIIDREPIEVSCSFSGKETTYEDEEAYGTTRNITGNRFMELADETVRFFQDFSSELESKIDLEKEKDSSTYCTSIDGDTKDGAKTSAVRSAVGSLEDSSESLFNSVLRGMVRTEVYREELDDSQRDQVEDLEIEIHELRAARLDNIITALDDLITDLEDEKDAIEAIISHLETQIENEDDPDREDQLIEWKNGNETLLEDTKDNLEGNESLQEDYESVWSIIVVDTNFESIMASPTGDLWDYSNRSYFLTEVGKGDTESDDIGEGVSSTVIDGYSEFIEEDDVGYCDRKHEDPDDHSDCISNNPNEDCYEGDRMEVEMEVTPEEVKFDWRVYEDVNQVIVDNVYTTLEFMVKSYRHPTSYKN